MRGRVDEVLNKETRKKTQEQVRFRQHVMYTAYHVGGYSLLGIARAMECHHTTALSAIVSWAFDKKLPCELSTNKVDTAL